MTRAQTMERIVAKGQLIPLVFTQDQVADSQAAVAMNLVEAAGRRQRFYVADGAAAGNVTVTGVATTDTLVFVGVFTTKASIATFADLTAEFTITATNTINNAAGTSTANNQLLVVVDRPNAVADITAITGIPIPWEFEVVGISIESSEARTAGTLTADATIDGTATGLQAVLNATDTTRAVASQGRAKDVGNAGSRVGVKITTASWTPVTADIAVTVWVVAHLEGY